MLGRWTVSLLKKLTATAPTRRSGRRRADREASAQRCKALCPRSEEQQRQSRDVSLQRTFTFISLFEIAQRRVLLSSFYRREN